MHYRTVGPNKKGRDFILADLHGCYELLKRKLASVRFNPACDRVFSVGDLADRGPQSLRCLDLLRQPWFFSARGNHESSMLYAALLGESAFPGCDEYLRTEAKWLTELTDVERRHLHENILPLVEALPLVLHVEDGRRPFNVLHAQAAYDNDSVMTDAQLRALDYEFAGDSVMWGRELYESPAFAKAWKAGFMVDEIHISPQPFSRGLSPTFVGHSIVGVPFLHRSHIFMDCGAYSGHPKSSLTLLEYGKVERLLRDVEEGMRCYDEEGLPV